jgi:cytochrome b involved in lipid metabolism
VEWLGRGNPKRRSSSSPQDLHRDPLAEPFFLHHACAEDARKHTMADVKRRNWVVLDGYVYDVQPFMDRHPGGRALLQRMLGTDITTAYHRIGHSSTARAWAEENCMGVLDRPHAEAVP